jgi:hypothetical protein
LHTFGKDKDFQVLQLLALTYLPLVADMGLVYSSPVLIPALTKSRFRCEASCFQVGWGEGEVAARELFLLIHFRTQEFIADERQHYLLSTVTLKATAEKTNLIAAAKMAQIQ